MDSQKTHRDKRRILPKDRQIYPSAAFDSTGVIIADCDNND